MNQCHSKATGDNSCRHNGSVQAEGQDDDCAPDRAR